MRALYFMIAIFTAMPAFAMEYTAANGNTYYRVDFSSEYGIGLTAGISCCSDSIEYNRINPPVVKQARHLHFTADIDQTPLSLHSYEKIVKAEYLPSGSVYISGDGPTLHLQTIQTREAWRELPLSKDGQDVSLEGLDDTSNITLPPALTTEQIVAAAKEGVAKDFVNDNSAFWLDLAKACRLENGELTGACRFYVHKATVKLTFEHEDPVLLTIDYLIGC